MNRILLSILFISNSFFFCHAATITWDGEAGDGLWSSAANWVGNILPVAGDDVILDNSIVTGNYTVNLPSGNVSTTLFSLTITPAISTTITLILPTTNTSSSAFIANGPGDAVVLNSGAVFINASGASSGTPVSVTSSNFFRINNGGRYVHRTQRGHTNYLVSRLSTASGTEKGIFEFDIPSSGTISLSNRTYGTLVFSSVANGGPVTYSGNGSSPLTINGDLIINTDVTFSTSLSADMFVKGDFQQFVSSTFNLQTSTNNNIVRLAGNVDIAGTITKSGTGLPILEFNGSANQDIYVTGSIVNNVTVRMNNANGVTAKTQLTFPYILDLQNGNIKTNTTNILTLVDDATATGGSVASFIDGPMIKQGDDNFTFPVGKGSIYAPVGFTSSGMAVTDEFQAEYFRQDPQGVYGTNYENPLNHISYVEYWQLEKVTGAATAANVILPVTEFSFAKVLNTLYVARYNSGDNQWKNSGADSRTPGPPVPPYVTGTITSSSTTNFGIFTLATTDPVIINPLPVKLLSFAAFRISNKESKITWQLADADYGQIKFELQRSINNNEFQKIQLITGGVSEVQYSVTDSDLEEGVIKYRLKITGEDGAINYSNIVLLSTVIKNMQVNAYPNPFRENVSINILSIRSGKADVTMFDESGRKLGYWQHAIQAGLSKLYLNKVNGLNKGIYFVVVNTGAEKEIIRLMKQ